MKQPLSVLFLGTSPFAVPSLEALAADPRFRIEAVVTQPDRPAGRSKTLSAPPVKEAAMRLGLPVEQPEDIRADFNVLALPKPDFLVVVSYGQILSQEILDFPRIAPINVHASLLPRWRGASPLQHAILADDKETGVTVQRMVKELDAGPVLAQDKVLLAPRETFQTLHDRIARMGATLLLETLAQPLRPVRQTMGDVTFCRKLSRADGSTDPQTMTAEEIDRNVRALNPWPGVTMALGGQDIKIIETDLTPHKDALPVPCAGGSTLHLITVQPAGKKTMTGAAWGRGLKASSSSPAAPR